MKGLESFSHSVFPNKFTHKGSKYFILDPSTQTQTQQNHN